VPHVEKLLQLLTYLQVCKPKNFFSIFQIKKLIFINYLECEPGIEVVVSNSQNFITPNDSTEEKEVVRIIYLNHFMNTEFKPNVFVKPF